MGWVGRQPLTDVERRARGLPDRTLPAVVSPQCVASWEKRAAQLERLGNAMVRRSQAKVKREDANGKRRSRSERLADERRHRNLLRDGLMVLAAADKLWTRQSRVDPNSRIRPRNPLPPDDARRAEESLDAFSQRRPEANTT